MMVKRKEIVCSEVTNYGNREVEKHSNRCGQSSDNHRISETIRGCWSLLLPCRVPRWNLTSRFRICMQFVHSQNHIGSSFCRKNNVRIPVNSSKKVIFHRKTSASNFQAMLPFSLFRTSPPQSNWPQLDLRQLKFYHPIHYNPLPSSALNKCPDATANPITIINKPRTFLQVLDI